MTEEQAKAILASLDTIKLCLMGLCAAVVGAAVDSAIYLFF